MRVFLEKAPEERCRRSTGIAWLTPQIACAPHPMTIPIDLKVIYFTISITPRHQCQ